MLTRIVVQDTITLEGVCGNDDFALVGFGQCVGKIERAIKIDF